jgi:hypothetical protein
VIGQVANQKNNRSHESADHAIAVRGPVFAPDKNITGSQENRAEAIERGIDGRQIVDGHDAFPKTK